MKKIFLLTFILISTIIQAQISGWVLSGNNNVSGSNSKLGSTNSNAVSFITNNTERIQLTSNARAIIKVPFYDGSTILSANFTTRQLSDNTGSFVASWANGNFGIGNSSPTQKLDVNGSIRVPGGDTNFIGTTDLTSLTFRINNERSGVISIDSGRCYFGYQAGKANTTAEDNTYFGWGAGMTNSTSPGNTGLGVKSLLLNTGAYNTGCGAGALESLLTGTENTSVGAYSMLQMLDGNGNVAMGRFALANSLHGDYNVAIGWRAMYGANTTATENTAVGGYGVLFSTSTGDKNTALGSQAGFNNDGDGNVFLGFKAGLEYTTKSNWLVVGSDLNHKLIEGDFANDSILLNGITKIVDGTQGAGKVFTSNAYGVGSWQAAGVITHTVFTPVTTNTITLSDNSFNAINPAGTIAVLTVNFPNSPADGDFVEVKFTQQVTTVTYVAGTGGATINSQVNGTVGAYYKWVYDSGTNTWD